MAELVEEGTVLIVDDEEMVLSSLSSFLSLETSYEVVAYTRAVEAIEYVREHEIDIVISDFLMPEMDGLSFLRGVRELRPDVPRVILTGYADKDSAIKAINDVGLYQYVEKPWNNDDLRLVIRNGIEKYRLMRKLGEKVAQINEAYAELRSIQDDLLKGFV